MIRLPKKYNGLHSNFLLNNKAILKIKLIKNLHEYIMVLTLLEGLCIIQSMIIRH